MMRLLDFLGMLALSLFLCELSSSTSANSSSNSNGFMLARNLKGEREVRSAECLHSATEQVRFLTRRQVLGWRSLLSTGIMPRLRGGSIVMEEKSAMELDEGEDRGSRSSSALQELHRCAREGDAARIREFASSALINRQDLSLGFTALHFAAREGHAAFAQALIEEGADVHVRSRNGYTALHLAAARGHAEVAEQLLMAGAEPAGRAMNGDSAIQIAARGGHELVAIMLQACALGPEEFAKSTQVLDSDEMDGGEGKEMRLMDEGCGFLPMASVDQRIAKFFMESNRMRYNELRRT